MSFLKISNSPKKLIIEQSNSFEYFCNEYAELITALGVAIGVKNGAQ